MATPADVEFYNENGYAVIKNFLTKEEVQSLKDEAKKIISSRINDPSQVIQLSEFGNKKWTTSIYEAKIHVEPRAIISSVISSDATVTDLVNKLGQGLQFDDDAASSKRITYSDKMKSLVKNMTGHVNPKVIQIMYLFKPPKIGEPRAPHQDESYFPTEPAGHLAGVWIALDDATVNNGCLQFVPGSHKTVPLTRHFLRLPEPEKGNSEGEDSDIVFKYTGHADYLDDDSKYEYVPCPVSSGDLVLIHGLVLHRSEANTSTKPRMAWAFHVYDDKDGVSLWKDQMIDDPGRLPSLYDTDA